MTRARRDAGTGPVGELAAEVGWRLAAYITRAESVAEARAWAGGDARSDAAERARLALDALAVAAGREGRATARTWLSGLNPALGDRSPASVIRDGAPHDVRLEIIAAARSMGA